MRGSSAYDTLLKVIRVILLLLLEWGIIISVKILVINANCVIVAQLEERWARHLVVAGSNPVTEINKNKKINTYDTCSSKLPSWN